MTSEQQSQLVVASGTFPGSQSKDLPQLKNTNLWKQKIKCTFSDQKHTARVAYYLHSSIVSSAPLSLRAYF